MTDYQLPEGFNTTYIVTIFFKANRGDTIVVRTKEQEEWAKNFLKEIRAEIYLKVRLEASK